MLPRWFARVARASALSALVAPCGVARAQGAGSFEDLAAGAGDPGDLAVLAAPLVGTALEACSGAARDPSSAPLDVARCRGVVRALRRQLPSRRFRVVLDDPAAVTVSDYDARIRGVRLGVSGCLACEEPLSLGDGGERRLVTLRVPDRGGRTLAEATELASVALSFEGIPEARTWLAEVRPRLRVELVFQPAAQEWSFGPSRGLAFRLLGARVFDRCTGEVLHSVPPSGGPVGPRPGDGAGCARGEARAEPARAAELPAQLAAADIARAMQEVRPAIDACVHGLGLRGSVNLRLAVSGHNGLPTSVTLEGPLEGTAVASCIRDAARKARFPRFGAESQRFAYPVTLGP